MNNITPDFFAHHVVSAYVRSKNDGRLAVRCNLHDCVLLTDDTQATKYFLVNMLWRYRTYTCHVPHGMMLQYKDIHMPCTACHDQLQTHTCFRPTISLTPSPCAPGKPARGGGGSLVLGSLWGKFTPRQGTQAKTASV
jgi:hypothetical protein